MGYKTISKEFSEQMAAFVLAMDEKTLIVLSLRPSARYHDLKQVLDTVMFTLEPRVQQSCNFLL